MEKMANKRYMIYCEPCSYKTILEPEDNDNLVEIKSTKIQSKLPILKQGKTEINPAITQPRKVKCPRCGRGVRVRELLTPFAKAIKEVDDKKLQEQLEADKLKRLEDGKFPERPTEFLG